MAVQFHPHALERMVERGTTEEEVIKAVEKGEKFTAKYGRIGFRHNFQFDDQWRGEHYATKQLEVYTVKEDGNWLVITVITKYFRG